MPVSQLYGCFQERRWGSALFYMQPGLGTLGKCLALHLLYLHIISYQENRMSQGI